MLKRYLLQLKTHHLGALREQKGQSLIIFVFAIMGIIALMGLALDLGLVYIERVRVSRTTDAAALAAVVELPFEEEAIRRAAEFIELNGYRREETEIRVRGCIQTNDSPLQVRNVGEGDPAVAGGAIYSPTAMVDNVPDNLIVGYVYQPALTNPPTAVFLIDTLSYQPVSLDAADQVTTPNEENCDGGSSPLYGTANKLRVSGQVDVRMNFMQFFGFSEVPVSDQAVGENVTNLDVVVVFDVSGSMDYETNCFGCWTKDPSLDILDNPYPTNGTQIVLNHEPEDEGGNHTIFWPDQSSTAGHPVCSASASSTPINTFNYLVHEAEFYSRTFPHNGWEFEKHTAGQGFWALQQTTAAENTSNNAYISAHPFVTYSQPSVDDVPNIQGGTYDIDCFTFDGSVGAADGECWSTKGFPDGVNNNVPYVEYDFTPDWSGDIHIWVRAMGSWSWSYEWDGVSPTSTTVPGDLTPYRTAFFWQVNDGQISGGEYELLGRKFRRDLIYTTSAQGGKDRWRWLKIADDTLTPNVVSGQQYTLRFYQGSSGFNIDKIIITDNPEGAVLGAVVDDGRSVVSTIGDDDTNDAGQASLASAGSNLAIADDVLSLHGGLGPDATYGSATREACNVCNPVYGETVDPTLCTCREDAGDSGAGSGAGCTFVTETVNQLTNDIFYDRAPLRNAKEAVKNFAARLDPKFDQLGVVAFGPNTPNRTKMQCLIFGGFDMCAGNTGAITYSFVIKDLEDYENVGGTNIALGMREGLEELGVSVPGFNNNVDHDCPDVPASQSSIPGVLDDDDKHACDRRGAARRVLILMTDGAPSRWPGYPSDPGNCPNNSIVQWQGFVGAGNQGYDCSIFYAEQAASKNVVVYTIGIGGGVNEALLTAMATGTDPMDPEDANDDIEYFSDKGGQFFPAANPSQLDAIFDQILSNIYVRIVG